MIELADLKIEHQILPLNGLRVEYPKDPKVSQSRKKIDKLTFITLPDERKLAVCARFWNSFCSLHNLSRSIFDYYSHAEIFERITTVRGTMVRVSLEGSGPADVPISIGTLIACTNPSKPVLQVQEIKNLVDTYAGQHITYESGIVQASFDAPFPQQFQVAGDEFRTRFLLQMPIDGYGLPCAYLELMRLKNHTATIGYSKAFKTTFQLGKDDNGLSFVLDRAMRTFNNEEGYHALKLRLDSATKSWASFYEAGSLRENLVIAMGQDGFDLPQKTEVLQQYDGVCGNPLTYYGMAGSNELSQRKAKTIPVNATVYELINFANELATHHLKSPGTKQRLNAWVGGLIANGEYDLEGTMDTTKEFQDFFLTSTKNLINPEGVRQLYLGDEGDPDVVVVDGIGEIELAGLDEDESDIVTVDGIGQIDLNSFDDEEEECEEDGGDDENKDLAEM